VRNRSEQFEARGHGGSAGVASIFLQGMAGSRCRSPSPTAKAMPSSPAKRLEADLSGCVAMRFVDNHGKVTEAYPANPNGSPRGLPV
jgi:phosphoribosylformylglycinamidine synthase